MTDFLDFVPTKSDRPPPAAFNLPGRFGGPDGSDAPGGPNDRPHTAPKPKAYSADNLPAYLANLNDRQREAAMMTEGPLIVLAGAGSGKTKMLTSRIVYLVDACRVAPYQILAVTFTNKAATEMRERVEKMLHANAADALGSPEIGTFHSICVRLIRREQTKTPFTKPFVIYDDSDQLSLIKASMSKLGIDDKAFNPKAIQGSINRAKCDAVEPHEVEPPPHNIFERQFKRVYEQYQKDLFANNALDFGEIICMTYRLLRDHADVRAKYQRRFRYIHVDEYQDTNRSQYLLLSMLAGKPQGGHQNICVVGDEDQSIYKWRGADIRNILDFEKDYPGASVVKLEQNYRSTKKIITAAGHVIRNNKTRKDKTLWTENEEGTDIIRAQLPDERAEAEMVVGEIKRLSADDDRQYSEFSIFYRTHAQSRQFEDVLRREKIPYQIVGGLRFYDRKEIKDILSYFKVVLNTSDSISLKRVINVPARGIGKTTLDKLDDLAIRLAQPEEKLSFEGEHDPTFWGALKLAAGSSSYTNAGTARKLAAFVKIVERLIADQPKLMLSELYHLILDETGYVRELRQEGTEESMGRIENLEEFDSLIQEFEEDVFEKIPDEESRKAIHGELLALFIEQSTLSTEAGKEGDAAGGSSVKMMSLHSSKGLEFPVVFLVGMEEGLFPSIRPWEETSDEDVEEERRLCYVGMTRAREQLYLSHVVVRRLWGNVTYQEPARFFAEMPDELIDFRDMSFGSGGSGRGFRSGSSSRLPGQLADQLPSQKLAQISDFSGYGGAGKPAHQSPQPGKPSGDFDDAKRGFDHDDVSQVSDLEGGSITDYRLNHPEYGKGKIVLADGIGEDAKITVEFANRDRRKFVLKYVRKYLIGG